MSHGLFIVTLMKRNIFQFRRKCGMAAMIRPVSIQHPDFSYCRVSFFLIPEICLYMQKIPESHSQAQGIVQSLQLIPGHKAKSLKNPDILRFFKGYRQCFWFLLAGSPGIHRINTVVLYCFQLLFCHITLNDIGYSAPDHRAFLFSDKLYALLCRICPLIKLSGQIFHRKNTTSFLHRETFMIQHIDRWFCKDPPACLFKGLIRNILHIITNKDTNTSHSLYSEIVPNFMS